MAVGRNAATELTSVLIWPVLLLTVFQVSGKGIFDVNSPSKIKNPNYNAGLIKLMCIGTGW